MAISNQQQISQPQTFIPTGNLRVAPYEIEQLHAVEIRQKINEHSTLYFKGLLKNTPDEDDAELAAEGTSVMLGAVDEYGEAYVLFQGIVKDVLIQNVHGTRHIEVKAVSLSYLLDIEERSRSFQDKTKPYTELIKQVASLYTGACVTDVATNGAATEKFIMQHEETDWEFLKRLASHFNTGLFCEAAIDKPSCYFGVPYSQAIQLGSTNYTVKKDIHRFNKLSENGVPGLSEDDFICYEVETNCIVMIGDAVEFRDKQLHVAEIISTANSGLLVNRLVLMPKKGLSQPYQPNKKVVGASYSGYILDVRNDRVKVVLNTDAGHDPGAPCWFPYSTIYSSKSGSGWYCMPEIGDSIRIYFPDGEDDHAYAISSVHEQVDDDACSADDADEYSGKRDNPKKKSLKYGNKEVLLTPDGIYIRTDNAKITLLEEGVTIWTKNDIEFNSEKNIILSAEEDVNIIGTTGVELACAETASITINENVEIVGQEVLAN